jgi:hypothetical protein
MLDRIWKADLGAVGLSVLKLKLASGHGQSTIQILPIQKYWIKKEADVGLVWQQLDCSALILKRANCFKFHQSERAWQSTIKILPICLYWIKSQANREPFWLKLDCSVSKLKLVSANHSKFDWSNLVQHHIKPIHTGLNQRPMEGQSGYSLTVQYQNQSLSVHITPSLIGLT